MTPLVDVSADLPLIATHDVTTTVTCTDQPCTGDARYRLPAFGVAADVASNTTKRGPMLLVSGALRVGAASYDVEPSWNTSTTTLALDVGLRSQPYTHHLGTMAGIGAAMRRLHVGSVGNAGAATPHLFAGLDYTVGEAAVRPRFELRGELAVHTAYWWGSRLGGTETISYEANAGQAGIWLLAGAELGRSRAAR
jgi:hypothetical protein